MQQLSPLHRPIGSAQEVLMSLCPEVFWLPGAGTKDKGGVDLQGEQRLSRVAAAGRGLVGLSSGG